jgi:quercetin dioxygenase-like cupin family protein
MEKLKAGVRPPGVGRVVEGLGNRLTLRLTAADTGGAFSVVEFAVSPGFVAPPLLHDHEAMDWYGHVLESTLAFDLDGETHEVGPGGIIHVPRGARFRWWNARPAPARWLMTYVPGGFEQYFVELAEALAALPSPPEGPRLAALVAPLWQKHGVRCTPI